MFKNPYKWLLYKCINYYLLKLSSIFTFKYFVLYLVLIILFLLRIENDDNSTKPKLSKLETTNVPIVKKPYGGLANILSQLGKKDKLTVLEKTKQDWDSYKKREGIAEELITYNKGKDGFVHKTVQIILQKKNCYKIFLVLGIWKKKIS